MKCFLLCLENSLTDDLGQVHTGDRASGHVPFASFSVGAEVRAAPLAWLLQVKTVV